MSGLGLTFLRRGNLAHPTAGNEYLFSATKGDAEVFSILMNNGVSSDGVGITIEDVAKVSSINTWFSNNSKVHSFDEFRFFTGVRSIIDKGFSYCTNLEYLTIPKDVASMGWKAFEYCKSLKVLTILRETVLYAKNNSLSGMVVSEAIYVPDNLVDSYKTASYWSQYADKFKPLSEYNG